MFTDTHLSHIARRDWLTDGPLHELVISYIEALRSRRYAENTLGAYLRCLAHFSYWMRGEGLAAADIDRVLIERFLRNHLPTCACPAPCRSNLKEMRAALHRLLELLPKVDDEVTTDHMAAELEHFVAHLRHTCGLAPVTCTYRVRHVSRLPRRLANSQVWCGCTTYANKRSAPVRMSTGSVASHH